MVSVLVSVLIIPAAPGDAGHPEQWQTNTDTAFKE